MKCLKKSDSTQKIVLEDIHAAGFSTRFPQIDKDKAMAVLHAQTKDGEFIYGLEVTYQAWKIVGKHRWLKITRFPFIKPLADYCYLFFAKYRPFISRILINIYNFKK